MSAFEKNSTSDRTTSADASKRKDSEPSTSSTKRKKTVEQPKKTGPKKNEPNIPTNNPPDLAEMEDEDLLISKPEGEIDATQSMAEGKMTAHENYEFSNITFTVRALALPTTTAPNLAIPLFSTDQWESRIMASNH